MSRCFLPKVDPVLPSHLSASPTHTPVPRASPHTTANGHESNEGSAQFKSAAGRRMSTFALSSGSAARPKVSASSTLGPQQSSESPSVPHIEMGVVEEPADAFAPPDSPDWLEPSALQPRADPSPLHSTAALSPVQNPSHALHKTRQRALPTVIRHHQFSNRRSDVNQSSRPASLPSHLGANFSSPSGPLQPSSTFSPFTQSVSPRARSMLLPSSSHKLPSALPAHVGTLGVEPPLGGGSTERQSAVERRKRMLALISTSRDEEVGGIINRPGQ
jgi:hypothetical protein